MLFKILITRLPDVIIFQLTNKKKVIGVITVVPNVSSAQNFECFVFSETLPFNISYSSSIHTKECDLRANKNTFCTANYIKNRNGSFVFKAEQKEQCNTDAESCFNTTVVTPRTISFKYCCNSSLCNSLAIAQITNSVGAAMTCENNIPIDTLSKVLPLPNKKTAVDKCFSCNNCALHDKGDIEDCSNIDDSSENRFCYYKYRLNAKGKQSWSGHCASNDIKSTSFHFDSSSSSYVIEASCSTELCNNPLELKHLKDLVLCEDGYYSSKQFSSNVLECNNFDINSKKKAKKPLALKNSCLSGLKPFCQMNVIKNANDSFLYKGNGQCSKNCNDEATITAHSSVFNSCCNTTNCNSISIIKNKTKFCQNFIDILSLNDKIIGFKVSNLSVTKCFSCANCNLTYSGSIVDCSNESGTMNVCQYRYINSYGNEFWYGGCFNKKDSFFYSSSTTDTKIIQKDLTCDYNLCNNPKNFLNAKTYVLCEDGFYSKKEILSAQTSSSTTKKPSGSDISFDDNKLYCYCSGGFIVDSKNQTVCVKDCNGIERLANEVDCTFPFQFNNEWYDTCTNASNNFYWCSIDSIYSGRFATCKQECSQLAINLMDENQTHTSCLPKAEGFVSYPVSDAEIQIILDQHNGIRSNVTVPAADMGAVYWDFGLSRLALRLAQRGVFKHDTGSARKLLNNRTIGTGQNLFASSGIIYNPSTYWIFAISGWYSEIEYFVYGNGSTTGDWKSIGHYTQLISSKTRRVGCAAAGKGNYIIAVCNYASAQLNVNSPYTSGKPCSNCLTSLCKNNLCYCEKFCQNGGTLNTTTCSCTCLPYATGPNCETLLCDKSDKDYGCWNSDRSNPWVCAYSNTAPFCPHTCGICDYLPARNYSGFFNNG